MLAVIEFGNMDEFVLLRRANVTVDDGNAAARFCAKSVDGGARSIDLFRHSRHEPCLSDSRRENLFIVFDKGRLKGH